MNPFLQRHENEPSLYSVTQVASFWHGEEEQADCWEKRFRSAMKECVINELKQIRYLFLLEVAVYGKINKEKYE